ncbi:MAG: hypothetical protein VX938_03580, partial [Myxococcota bacterium]|nr:hypothetical protein [Myxococcota bacterium]
CILGDQEALGWIGASCQGLTDCHPGLTCGSSATCEAQSEQLGQSTVDGPCTRDSECLTGLKCHAPCDPSCDGRVCGDDGCGGSCGDCGSGEKCEDGQCIIPAGCTEPQCDGKQCGDDGCGNICGECPSVAPHCDNNICTSTCVPVCDGKDCGDDGCGGVCGTCEGDTSCWATQRCFEPGSCGQNPGALAEAVGVCTEKKAELSRLGEECLSDGDCISGVCLRSEYSPPFCTRPCEFPQESCPAGEDADDGDSLCISFDVLPDPNAPPFTGDLTTFCVPRCKLEASECKEQNLNWEVCSAPLYLGDPLYPSLGTNVRICQAPSYYGKDPVDPSICDWEKTIDHFYNEANLCRNYCKYLQTCQEIAADADMTCCEWGCFNQMVIDGEVNDTWYDLVKCFWDFHNSYPAVGAINMCSQPPIDCKADALDPTPSAAKQ